MITLVDIVNFNADASCLEGKRWLDALKGGLDSEFCSWLRLYIENKKPLVVGLTGATIADLAAYNPESLELIRDHPEIFGLVARPFSHDIALVRESAGFCLNLRLGLRAMEWALGAYSTTFLPPEFMLSNEQIAWLVDYGIDSVFLNPARFSLEIQKRLPHNLYQVYGVDGKALRCIPILGEATQRYLESIHCFDATPWNAFFADYNDEVAVTWRDGESPFLIPDGIVREAVWLTGEKGLRRVLLDSAGLEIKDEDFWQSHHLRAYPVHSFQSWMKEFRMIGYLGRLQRLEPQVTRFSPLEQLLWLQAINSDVLSAVEKRSPVIHLLESTTSDHLIPYIIWRTERGFEGESVLHALDAALAGDLAPAGRLLASDTPFAMKLRGRLRFLQEVKNLD